MVVGDGAMLALICGGEGGSADQATADLSGSMSLAASILDQPPVRSPLQLPIAISVPQPLLLNLSLLHGQHTAGVGGPSMGGDGSVPTDVSVPPSSDLCALRVVDSLNPLKERAWMAQGAVSVCPVLLGQSTHV